MPRIPDTIKRPGQILASGPGNLHRLMDHARELLDLQAQLRRLVPGEIFVAAFDADCLHLITPSSALATRLKYNQKKLLAILRQHSGRRVARIKVSVRPEYIQTRTPATHAANPISPENARHLAAAAKYIEDDALRKALVRLSNRASDA